MGRAFLCAALGLFSAACGSTGSTTSDAGAFDAGAFDAGAFDAGAFDAGAPDAGAFDAGQFNAGGFGALRGTCGRVAPELGVATPSFFDLRLDFGADGFDDPQERPRLTAGAQQILSEGTAGGSSEISEAFAFDVLARCEGAALLKSETQIVYTSANSKKTDILVQIAGQKVGVSVTRAFTFPLGTAYTPAQAAQIIERKLSDILDSTANVGAGDRWVKQLLVVMAFDAMAAASVRAAWDAIAPGARADTVVYVVVTDGDDASVY